MSNSSSRATSHYVRGCLSLMGRDHTQRSRWPTASPAYAEHGLDSFARVYAEAGFVVLVHDHRGFGASDGQPRCDVDPWRQIADWRYAISYLESHPAVDADRIGLWGSSYAGGHALVLGATDRRLKAVVAQVPTISGYEQSLRRVPPEQVGALEASFIDDDQQPVRR